jgi:hypothetical protein
MQIVSTGFRKSSILNRWRRLETKQIVACLLEPVTRVLVSGDSPFLTAAWLCADCSSEASVTEQESR